MLVLLAALSASAGCSAVRGVLRPWVCECEVPATDEASPAHSHDDGSLAEDEADVEDDEAEELSPEDAETSDEVLTEAELTPVEVVVPGARVAVPERGERLRPFGLETLREESLALVGDFSRREGGEAFVIVPEQEVAVYGAEGRIAREPLSLTLHDAFPASTISLPDGAEPVQALELVRDDTQQVAVATVEPGADGQTLVWLTILKPIGGRVGRIFRAPLARLRDGGYEAVGRVDFLQGRHHRIIRYTPLDEGETSGWLEPQVFRWNRWEGIYRVPTPPPTAPARS